MALFQRRPQNTSDNASFYTLGLNKTILLVGLGNIGKQYDGTRHNLGFACLDAFAKSNDFPNWVEKKDLKSVWTSTTLNDTRVMLIKPTTLMNLSGESVQAVSSFYKITPENIAVVHDELDIPFGQIRTRFGGTAAGHNGIKSIIEHISADFGRVRIGIGPRTAQKSDNAAFVLDKFTQAELGEFPALTREVSAILSEYIFSGQRVAAETRSFLF